MDVVLINSTSGLSTLKLRLRQHGVNLTVAQGVSVAMLALQRHRPDALVVELDSIESGTMEILELAKRDHPELMRVAIARTSFVAELESRGLAHRVLERSEDVQEIVTTLQSSLRFRELLRRREGRRLVGSVGRLPTLPGTYKELGRLRDSATASARSLVEVLEEDPANCAAVLRMARSAHNARGNSPVDLHSAVVRLGVDAVMGLVLLNSTLENPEELAEGFCLERFNARSVATAKLAVALDLHPQPSEVYTAGLLADFGSLLLAHRLPGPYGRVLRLSRERPIVECERELFFATHQEFGAGILALWGVPPAVVDAVYGHHDPARVQHPTDPLLLAVIHIATCLLEDPSQLDLGFLTRQGIRVPEDTWGSVLQELEFTTESVSDAVFPNDDPDSAQDVPASALQPEHNAHSLAVWGALVDCLIGSDPGKYRFLARAKEMVEAVVPVLQRDQEIFALGCILLGLQHSLGVSTLEFMGFSMALQEQGSRRLGTALSLSREARPSGRDSDQALHLVARVLHGMADGHTLGNARADAISAHDYPIPVEEALLDILDSELVVSLYELEVGMVLAQDLLDDEGRLLASSGQRVTGRTIEPLRRLAAAHEIRIQAA